MLLLLIVQRMAHGQNGQSSSQTGIAQAQPQMAAGFDGPAAGFDNSAVAFAPASEATDLIAFGIPGFMFGAAIVLLQTLRRRFFPASVRAILLHL